MVSAVAAGSVVQIIATALSLMLATCCVNAEDYDSRLWRVTGDELHGESYIYGTWNSRDTRAFTFDNAVFKAFDACEFLALEALPDSMSSEFVKLLTGERTAPGDVQMERALGEAEFKLIAGMMKQYANVNRDELGQYSPVGLEYTFEQAVCEQTYPYAPTTFFYGYARTRGMEIMGLEPAELHVSALEYSHSLKRWQNCTVFFQRYQGRPNLTSDVLERYARGDVGEAVNIMSEFATPDEEDQWRGTRQRNTRMAQHALDLMRQQPTFMAVDAMRLTGPIGLINNLRELGCNVEAIPENKDKPARTQIVNPEAYEWPVYADSLAQIAFAMPHEPARVMPEKFKLPDELHARSMLSVDTENACIYMVIIMGIPGMENGGTVSASVLSSANKSMLAGMNKSDSSAAPWVTRAATIGGYPALSNKGRMADVNKPAEVVNLMSPGHLVMLIAIAFRANDYKGFERFFDSVQGIR